MDIKIVITVKDEDDIKTTAEKLNEFLRDVGWETTVEMTLEEDFY